MEKGICSPHTTRCPSPCLHFIHYQTGTILQYKITTMLKHNGPTSFIIPHLLTQCLQTPEEYWGGMSVTYTGLCSIHTDSMSVGSVNTNSTGICLTSFSLDRFHYSSCCRAALIFCFQKFLLHLETLVRSELIKG